MKYRLTLLSISLFFLVTVRAQNLSPTLISVQGGDDLSFNVSLEWSLGENSVETIYSVDKIYTQGFLQTYGLITGYPTGEQEFLSGHNLLLYPNPVHSKLYIKSNEDWPVKVNVILCDLDQRIISKSTILPEEPITTIDVLGLARGMYILRLHSSDGQFFESHKIIKY